MSNIIRFADNRDITDLSLLAMKVIYDCIIYSENARMLEAKEYSIENITQKMKDNHNLYLIYMCDNKMIGFCHGYFDMGTYWINWIGTDLIYRRKKIATSLLHYMEKYLKKEGVHKIWFATKSNNIQSINFFLRHGYEIRTVLKNHWYNADFYIWQKIL